MGRLVQFAHARRLAPPTLQRDRLRPTRRVRGRLQQFTRHCTGRDSTNPVSCQGRSKGATGTLAGFDLDDLGLAVAGDLGAVFAHVNVYLRANTEPGQVNARLDRHPDAVDDRARVVWLPPGEGEDTDPTFDVKPLRCQVV